MQILLIVFVNIYVYYRTVNFHLIMDDMQWYDKYKEGLTPFKSVKNLNQLKRFIQDRLYGGTTFSLNPKIEHAFTLFLHTLIGCLIYLTFGVNQISLMAALLYSCHPINTQTSIWLNGRRYAVNVILVLLIILLAKFGMAGRAAAVLLYFSTGLFHMTGVFVPVIFGFIPSLMVFGCIGAFRKEIKARIKGRENALPDCDQKHFTPNRVIVVVKSYGFYFFKMLFPGYCAMMYPDLFYWGKTKEGNKDAYSFDRQFVKGCFALVITTLGLIFIPVSYRGYMVFMALAIMQWCNIIPVVQVLADRYMSVANVFMMLFLSYIINSIFHQWSWIPFFLIFGYYYAYLLEVIPMYRDIVSFYNYHIELYPQMPWPRVVFIASLLENGNVKEALQITKDGITCNPRDYSLLIYGAIMSLIRGDYKSGTVFLDEAEKNFYIGQEKTQAEEVKNFRSQLEVIKNVISESRK